MKQFEYFKRFSVIIISGGSSGIGLSIIKTIVKIVPSAQLCNLSRSKPDISLGDNGQHYPVDLSDAQALAEAAEALKARIDFAREGEVLLINNSGFGDYGRFHNPEMGKQLKMIDLNLRAVVDLSARLLPVILPRGGTIVTIASTAAFQPTPFLATYGATKAFVRNWSLALSEDLRGTKVRTLVVCPGPTRSNFFKAAGFETPPMDQGANQGLNMSSDQVAAYTLRAVSQERSLIITGWKNRLITFLGSQLPLVAVTRIGAGILRKMRLEKNKTAKLFNP
ncbi:MAG: SDR family NAD(P)-dependent oxidoreductase [Verrucomicrobiota bacterium]|nr:SDR family NAD(P)-dependent oxidoreductase [Verrucomicrobiota bacterium]